MQNVTTARIAHAAIWNTNLTAAEIAKLNLGWPPTLISPSSLLPAGTMTGTDDPELDASGNGNHLDVV